MNRYQMMAAVVPLLVASCTFTRNVSNEPEYARVVNVNLKTKVPLFMHELDRSLVGQDDRHLLYPSKIGYTDVIGVIPKGYVMRFRKGYRYSNMGGGGERVEGDLLWRGKTYPVTYFMGISEIGSERRWKSFYRIFEVE